MTEHREALIGKPTNQLDVRLLRSPVMVLIGTLVRITVPRLRMLDSPRGDLVGVDKQRIVLDPRGELVQPLCFVVSRHTRRIPIIPAVHAADDVIADDGPIRHQGAPVLAAAVQDGMIVTVPHNDQIHPLHQRCSRNPITEFTPRSYRFRTHTFAFPWVLEQRRVA